MTRLALLIVAVCLGSNARRREIAAWNDALARLAPTAIAESGGSCSSINDHDLEKRCDGNCSSINDHDLEKLCDAHLSRRANAAAAWFKKHT